MPDTIGSRGDSTAGFENAHALVVGIAGYATIRKLPRTQDACDVASLLRDPEVCGYRDVKLLHEQEASKPAIVGELERLADVPNGSTVMIYFSGHGGHVEDGPHRGDYLLPVECAYPDEKALAESSISSQEFTGHLNRIAMRADRLVVMLDCCHAGGIGDTKDLQPSHVRPGLDEGSLDTLAQGKGRVIIAAARSGEPAYVVEGERNGAFTRHLLQGLRGDALGHRGVIRIADLYDYVKTKLKTSTQPQRPFFKAAYEENFPIALHLGGKPGSGEIVRGGLSVLIGLIRDRTLAPVLDQARRSLETAREQITFAAGLKQLHDALHEIQLNQFEHIMRERKGLGQDEMAGPNLVRHARKVARVIGELDLPAALRLMPELQLEDRLGELTGAVVGIEEGATAGTARLIDGGIWELNEILSVLPSRLNTELMRIVRTMGLHDVFKSLLEIQARMHESSANQEDIRCLTAGGRDLGRLDRDIDDLMFQHDHWQRVDELLRRIDNNGKGPPSDLEFAWPKLNRLIQEQLEAVDAGLGSSIAEACGILQTEIASANAVARASAFRLLRDYAGEWFFKVDRRLLGICKELIPIGEAMDVVLKALKEP